MGMPIEYLDVAAGWRRLRRIEDSFESSANITPVICERRIYVIKTVCDDENVRIRRLYKNRDATVGVPCHPRYDIQD